jgi:hypothetical protein
MTRYLLLLWILLVAVAERGTSQVSNRSGVVVAVYGIDPTTQARVLLMSAPPDAATTFPLNALSGHVLEVREVADEHSGLCHGVNHVCRSAAFQISATDGSAIHITADAEALLIHQEQDESAGIAFRTTENKCQRAAQESLAKQGHEPAALERALDDLVDCVAQQATREFEKVHRMQASALQKVAEQWEAYVCVDDQLNTTDDIARTQWEYGGQSYPVHVQHELPASNIHLIHNFITSEECAAIAAEANTRLEPAKVFDSTGRRCLSPDRKALHARVQVPWEVESADNPIARLSRRIFNYTNSALGLTLDAKGQEDLRSVQYSGRGRHDHEPDQYKAHCDGECTGGRHKLGSRVASMIMYCRVADVGGHTVFRQSGVHIKPEVGR